MPQLAKPGIINLPTIRARNGGWKNGEKGSTGTSAEKKKYSFSYLVLYKLHRHRGSIEHGLADQWPIPPLQLKHTDPFPPFTLPCVALPSGEIWSNRSTSWQNYGSREGLVARVALKKVRENKKRSRMQMPKSNMRIKIFRHRIERILERGIFSRKPVKLQASR